MKFSSKDERAGQEERRDALRLCVHCDLLGASAVISADRESNEMIYCSLCNVRFHFHTEGNRIIVTKVEQMEG